METGKQKTDIIFHQCTASVQSENSDFITKQLQVESNKKALLESNNEQSLRIVESRNEGTKVLIKEIAPNILSKE